MKNLIKKHKRFLAICILFVFAAGFAGTYVQFLKGELLDAALAGINSGVIRLAILFFAAIALEMGAYYGYDYFRGRLSVANKKTLRQSFFEWLLGRSPVGYGYAAGGVCSTVYGSARPNQCRLSG